MNFQTAAPRIPISFMWDPWPIWRSKLDGGNTPPPVAKHVIGKKFQFEWLICRVARLSN